MLCVKLVLVATVSDGVVINVQGEEREKEVKKLNSKKQSGEASPQIRRERVGERKREKTAHQLQLMGVYERQDPLKRTPQIHPDPLLTIPTTPPMRLPVPSPMWDGTETSWNRLGTWTMILQQVVQ